MTSVSYTNNIVLKGVGVRVLRRDEGIERAMVFHRKNEMCTVKHSV